MKRKLLVIRHANTEHQQPGQTDHQRELTDKGRSDALRVAERIQELGWAPQTVVSSDATRTRQTWEQFAQVFRAPTEVEFTRDLYLADIEKVCEALFALDADVTEVAILGHNPGWQSAVHWLSGVAVRMSPGTAVLLEGRGETWAEAVQKNQWELDQVLRPEQI